jgi:hypothetical protein
MGHRNPDRVPLAYRRARCETVEQMRAERWDVISKCARCELIMQVDLGLIIKVSGPRVSLWNRKARCRRLGCNGFVEFQAKAPGMGWHEELRADDREPLQAPPAWIGKYGKPG